MSPLYVIYLSTSKWWYRAEKGIGVAYPRSQTPKQRIMLSILLLIPILGIAAILLVSSNESQSKKVALGASLANFALSLVLWAEFDGNTAQFQFVQDWTTVTNKTTSTTSFCHFIIGLDGISLFFVLLTTFIIPTCILATWHTPLSSNPFTKGIIGPGVNSFLIALLVVETLLIALFVVVDLLLFYICFESVLIPLFLLIGIWSTGQTVRKVRASFLLFLYTLFGSLFMLLGIVVIYMATGTTDLQLLTTVSIDPSVQRYIWLGFFLALAIKTPLVPLHLWLPFAHVNAPLAGSLILAGLILKLATYGYLRLCIGFLPEASFYFTPLVYTLCLISILYTCLATLRQENLKSIVAYSSISHMAISVMGIFSNTIQGIEGAIMLSFAHGIVSPALFICVSAIYDRWHTYTLPYYRGLALIMPLFSLLFFLFILANMALPATGNFIGEFLSLLGAFQRNPLLTVLASSSVVLTAAYSIWFFNRVCFGAFSLYLKPSVDLSRREFFLLLPSLFLTVVLGIAPNLILDSIHFSVSNLLYTL
jgi:NADH-ubiquinone oxidoreductase chain 4